MTTTMNHAAHPQRILSKPTLLDIVNNRREVTLIRLAIASQLPRNAVYAAMRSNAATPQVATKIATGLTLLTHHRYTVMDIDIAVHPAH